MSTQPLTAQRIEDEDFFSLVGLEGISNADKEEILGSMSETVHTRVYALIYESLSDSEKAKFYDLPIDKLIPFLEEKHIDVASMVMEEAMKYKVELATMFNLATHPTKTVAA